MSQRTVAKRAWYWWLHMICRLIGLSLFRIRATGRRHVPDAGGALVVCNHQSHLDVLVVGLSFDRRLNYLARQSLFRFPPLRWLISSLDAIPIDRDGTGLSGLKETLRRLKNDEMVLIFPEGTRTPDGNVQHFKPGFTTVARRAGTPIIPLALDGAFDCLPRDAVLPCLTAIDVVIGKPIMPEEIARYSERALGEEVERRVRACMQTARERRLRRTRPWGAPLKPRPQEVRPRDASRRLCPETAADRIPIGA